MNKDDYENDMIGGHVPFTVGLINPTNTTCFANSILQCMFNDNNLVSSFTTECLHQLVSLSLPNNVQIIKHFVDLILANYRNNSEDSSKSIRLLMLRIFDKSNIFQPNQQQDSHEFMVFFFQWLLEELNNLHAITMSSNANSLPGEIHLNQTRLDIRMASKYIEENMFLEVTQTTQCHICKTKSVVKRMEILSLSIDNCNDINACLAKHFAPSQLSAATGNAYRCDNCNKLVTATQTIRISKLPEILILNLKIFDNNVSQIYKKLYIFYN